MLDWFPVEPSIDFIFRYGSHYLPSGVKSDVVLYSKITTFLVAANYLRNSHRWYKQKRFGKLRDAKDREQDRRLDKLEGKETMFPLENRQIGGYKFRQWTPYTLNHLGTDYRAAKGTPLRAPFDGEIIAQYQGTSGGKMIYYRSDWDRNKIIRFMHLDRYAVGVGRVSKGQVIAYTGNTGLGVSLFGKIVYNSVAHLHIDINQNPSALMAGNLSIKNFIDPESYNWAGPEVHVLINSPVGRFETNLQPSQSFRDEVVRVHKFLVAKGYLSINDNEYGYYGKKTQAAIDRFQKDNGIYASSKYYGWWYDKTREKANQLI